jgi:putative DNA primase/helicase
VASLLANSAPKGLLIVRDELAGWLMGMNNYNDAGRQFWIESYNGGPYRVERQKNAEPIVIPRLAVAVTGGIQPEKLAQLFRDPDDGLLARMLWAWPEPLPFRLGRDTPDATVAIDRLDRLRLLELAPGQEKGQPACPVMVPLDRTALPMLETFGRDMQARQQQAGGLMRSAYGKGRGLALRISLVLEFLRWCAAPGWTPPPVEIGADAFADASDLVADFFMPMAERVYGDAAAPLAERNTATLAKWILQTKPRDVHIRHLQREVRLPGLRDAQSIRRAAALLVEADWLRDPPEGGQAQRAKVAYPVNPALWTATHD